MKGASKKPTMRLAITPNQLLNTLRVIQAAEYGFWALVSGVSRTGLVILLVVGAKAKRPAVTAQASQPGNSELQRQIGRSDVRTGPRPNSKFQCCNAR